MCWSWGGRDRTQAQGSVGSAGAEQRAPGSERSFLAAHHRARVCAVRTSPASSTP